MIDGSSIGGGAAMRGAPIQNVDAAALPSYAFGDRSVMWWGTLGVMAIEGTVFALAVLVYFYVRTRVSEWPPGVARPNLFWGTLNVAIMLASILPNAFTKRAAERQDLRGVRIGLVTCIVFAAAFIVVRAFEFPALNVRWDTNAYGSAVWMLLGLHTTHLVTDFLDTVVLGVLMITGPLEGRRFVDVSENAFYWYFVVGSWLPIYAVLYLAPFVL
jgi:heme/copper-type cytochrome/quinol oxidase subunit 3